MKVMYITYDGLNDPLGRSQIAPYLNRLSRMGVEYTVISFEKKLPVPGNIIDAGIDKRALKYHKSPSVVSTAYDIICGTVNAFFGIKRNKIGMVHARGYMPALMALFLKGLLGVKFIFDMRGFFADERAEAGIWKKGGLLYRAAKRLERSFFLSADRIVSLTESGKREIESLEYMAGRRSKITVIPTCVDLDKFRMRPYLRAEGANTFIYAGSLSTWYMPGEMADFVNVARKTGGKWRFLILTPEKDYARALMKRRGIDSVEILSAAYDDVPGYIYSATAGLAFYKPGFSRRGCSPTKLGEYLACGIPVIINSGIGDSDNIVEGEAVGVVIRSFSEGEYQKAAEKIKGLLSEGEALALRCRRAAEQYFSIENGAEKFYKIYEELSR